MEWRIAFYRKSNGQCPVTDFLGSLTDKHTAKILRGMQLVQEFGPEMGMPSVEVIRDGIQCLRVQLGSDIFRLFFFVSPAHTLVFLHGFRKKTPKTPPREIDRALRYRADFLNRTGDEHE